MNYLVIANRMYSSKFCLKKIFKSLNYATTTVHDGPGPDNHWPLRVPFSWPTMYTWRDLIGYSCVWCSEKWWGWLEERIKLVCGGEEATLSVVDWVKLADRAEQETPAPMTPSCDTCRC